MPADGYVLDHPNREKASSKATKAVVVLLLLVSALLLAAIAIGGWLTLEGAKALHVAYVLLYVLLAGLIARWRRGVLPVAGALAVVLLIFAAVSAPRWFDRDGPGYTDPALDAGLLGLLTVVLIPIQVLLILFAARGFQQAWHVEVERPVEDRRPGTPAPA